MKMLPDARDRCVSICFDEVHLEDRARYSSRWREMVPGETSCVVVVVRGLGSYSFREIVYYAPKNIDRQMLEALIVKVESCNCKVKAVTFSCEKVIFLKTLLHELIGVSSSQPLCCL